MRGLGTDHVISGPTRGIEITHGEGTYRQTNGHCNYKTDSAQRAESVKIILSYVTLKLGAMQCSNVKFNSVQFKAILKSALPGSGE